MPIVAMSSSTLSGGPGAALLNEYLFGLVDPSHPRICFLPTAVGDSAESIAGFYGAFPAGRCEPSHLTLFNRTVDDLRSYLLQQDMIYVNGGNTANMLAVWRLHGLDAILREAWQLGTLLCGFSAGGLCWFESGITDSFGPTLTSMQNCLGFLPGSFCPHYDSELSRRPAYQGAIAEGLTPGWAVDDGVALHFEGTELRAKVSTAPSAHLYRLEEIDGEVRETAIEPQPLW